MKAKQNWEGDEGDYAEGHDCHSEPEQGWDEIILIDDFVGEDSVDDKEENEEEFAPND